MTTIAEYAAQLYQAALRFDARTQGGSTFAVGKAQICRDIASRILARGSFFSERQKAYAEALIRWSQQERPSAGAQRGSENAAARSAQREVSMSGMAVGRIVELLVRAQGAGLRRPKIRLQRGEWRIVLYPAPSHGRHPNDYYVRARSATHPRYIYMGRIARADGVFYAHPDCSLDVMTALREFSENPGQVATAYGQAHGQCCFCGLGLTDGRSVAMGYGPICAEHYGLPWGDERAPSHVTMRQPPREEQQAERLRREVAATIANRRALRLLHDAPTSEDRPRGQAPITNDVPLSEDDEDKHFM